MDSYMKTTKALKKHEINEALAFQANCLLAQKKHDKLLAFLKEKEMYELLRDF